MLDPQPCHNSISASSSSLASTRSATPGPTSFLAKSSPACRPSSRFTASNCNFSDSAQAGGEPKHVSGNVFVRGGLAKSLPRSDTRFDDIVDTLGVPLVFNSEALEQFMRLVGCGYPLLLRRPAGWGLELFVTMLVSALDRDYDRANDPFTSLLGADYSTLLCPRGLHGYIILELDFSRVHSESDLRGKLSRFVSAHCRATLRHYGVKQPFPTFGPETPAGEVITTFALFLSRLRPSTPVFLVIKNFDSLAFGASDGRQVLEEFLADLEFQCDENIIGGTLLASTLDDGSLYSQRDAFGNPASSPYPVDLRSTLDLTRHPGFQSVVGFTEKDINDLDKAFKWKQSPGPRLLDMVKESVPEPVFFADEVWCDNRVAPMGPGGSAVPRHPPQRPDIDWFACPDGVFPARAVMASLEKKYGLPHRT
ncbi:hypothetical protein HMN09_00405500 [Mycena chlorophos]|uniref:Uncharacterized protein n=1 Tax=Mycena chlorophos TaxID=658473 RepID=A0A8H6WFF6_MYCCL|nr:hypothetical protein HMN09_00405500 [Mycena chlorophos]